MSVLVSTLVQRAAHRFGDPNMQRVSQALWFDFYNDSARELCEKANVLKFRQVFTIDSNSAYEYPPEMTVMTALEVTDQPSDEKTFRYLDEMFEDEFRAATNRSYPQQTLPTHYYSSENWFYLVGAPSSTIIGGGRITHFGIPDTVVGIDLAATMATPDFTQDYIVRRMLIFAKLARNRLIEAKTDLDLWETDVGSLGDSMQDRSQDRRSSMAPRKNRYVGMNILI